MGLCFLCMHCVCVCVCVCVWHNDAMWVQSLTMYAPFLCLTWTKCFWILQSDHLPDCHWHHCSLRWKISVPGSSNLSIQSYNTMYDEKTWHPSAVKLVNTTEAEYTEYWASFYSSLCATAAACTIDCANIFEASKQRLGIKLIVRHYKCITFFVIP